MSAPDVSELLYDSETVEREVAIGDSRLVVTSHRLLAVTPEAPGANFRKIDRPNVEDVSVGTDSSLSHVINAVALFATAIPLIAAGRVLSFDGMFEGLETDRGARAIGVDTGFLDTLGFVFGLIDDALLWSGVACLALVVLFAALYVRSRTTVVRIGVAGDSNVSFAVGNAPDVDRGVAEVRHALGMGPPPDAVDGDGTDVAAGAGVGSDVDEGAGVGGGSDVGEDAAGDDRELEYGT